MEVNKINYLLAVIAITGAMQGTGYAADAAVTPTGISCKVCGGAYSVDCDISCKPGKITFFNDGQARKSSCGTGYEWEDSYMEGSCPPPKKH